MMKTHRARLWLPTAALMFGIGAVSMAAILVRWANAPATVIGFWRMAFAAVAMLLPFAHAAQSALGKPARAEHNSRYVVLTIVAGFFFALNLAAWNTSAQITTAANVTLLGNLSVVWVSLTAMILFKQKLRRAFWGGLALALIGVTIILGQDLIAHPAFGVGDLFAIAASFAYTVYLLVMERARAGLNALGAWWISTVVCGLTLLGMSVALGASLTAYPLTSFAIFAVMAFVVQIGGFLSLNFAQGHLPAPIVSASLLAQPVLTALLAVPLLGQALAPSQLIGGALVLGGIVTVHKSRISAKA